MAAEFPSPSAPKTHERYMLSSSSHLQAVSDNLRIAMTTVDRRRANLNGDCPPAHDITTGDKELRDSLFTLDMGIDSMEPGHSEALVLPDVVSAANPADTLIAFVRPLGEILRAAMCKPHKSGSRPFLPRDQLQSIIHPDSVRRELKRCMPKLSDFCVNIYAVAICGPGRNGAIAYKEPRTGYLQKIFAILALINKVDAIRSFLSGGISDSILPISKEHGNDGQTVRIHSRHLPVDVDQCFTHWNVDNIDAFADTQWVFLAPFFQKPRGNVPFYELDPESILPWTEDESTNVGQSQTSRKGGFGNVWRVKIHDSHHNFNDDDSYTGAFAIKELFSAQKGDFDCEVDALKRFVSSPHPHVVKLLGAFKRDNTFYMLFPWADGDLRSFWEANPNPGHGADVLWLSRQLLGLAEGLHALHRSNYRHGDLKPENILWFKNSDGGEVLKIADFGLASDSRDKLQGYSPTYRAPEVDLQTPISRAYDIWSLSCVLLEFIIWQLHGYEGVCKFASHRASTSTRTGLSGGEDDAFFGFQPSEKGAQATANLKSSVVEWIENSHEAKGASTYTHELLNLIQNEMLVVDSRMRATSPTVVDKLEKMHEKCVNDPEYRRPKPSVRKPPWNAVSFETSQKRSSKTIYRRPQTISVNMARIPSYCQPNHTFTTTTHSQSIPQIEANEWAMNKSNRRFASTSNAQPSDIGHSHTYPANESNDIATLFSTTPEFTQDSIPEGPYELPTNRKRKLGKILEFSGMEDENRKKMHRRATLGLQPVSRGRQPVRESEGQQPQIRSFSMSTALETQNTAPLFACPFYQHDPVKYGTKTWKSCIGPGWTIPRLKEHIYRRHYSAAHRCDRCFEAFESAAELTQHHRADMPCLKQHANQDFETIDDFQKSQIQKKIRGKSDFEKWSEIYRVIFRLDAVTEIPSPYCETRFRGIGGGNGLATDTDSLTDFEGDLTSRLQHNLDQKTESDIRTCLQMVQSFRQSKFVTQSTVMSDVPSLIQDAFNINSHALESNNITMSTANPETEVLEDLPKYPEKILDSLSCLDHSDFPSGFDDAFPGSMFYLPDTVDDEWQFGVLSEG